MKLAEIIPEGGILDDLKSTTKEEVVKEMVSPTLDIYVKIATKYGYYCLG